MHEGHPGTSMTLCHVSKISTGILSLKDPFCHIWCGNDSLDTSKSFKVLFSMVVWAEPVYSRQTRGALEGK